MTPTPEPKLLESINFYKGIIIGVVSFEVIKSLLAIIMLFIIFPFGGS